MIQFLADWLLIGMVIGSVLLLILGIPKGQRLDHYKILLIVGLTAIFIARIMSLIPVNETRPFIEQGIEAGATYMDNPGFPSDHTLLAFTLAFAVIFLTKFRKIGYLLFVLAIFVGIGRVLALVHSPLDVVGGLGAAGLAAVIYIVWGRNER